MCVLLMFVHTANSSKPVNSKILRPFNSSKPVHPDNSSKPVCPFDVSKSARPVDVCKPACLVDIPQHFSVDYWQNVTLFLILLFFAVSENTSDFNRTILYMIIFINIQMTYLVFTRFHKRTYVILIDYFSFTAGRPFNPNLSLSLCVCVCVCVGGWVGGCVCVYGGSGVILLPPYLLVFP